MLGGGPVLHHALPARPGLRERCFELDAGEFFRDNLSRSRRQVRGDDHGEVIQVAKEGSQHSPLPLPVAQVFAKKPAEASANLGKGQPQRFL